MLTMSFVNFNIWQIKQAESGDFAKGVIGFGRDVEQNLLEATSPFVFSTVNERTILRLLKLIACDNGKIGTYAKLVDDRNDTAHPNGNIFFSTQPALDAKIAEILRAVDEIQTHSRPVIERCYQEFLVCSADVEEREYLDPAEQIREVLIHGDLPGNFGPLKHLERLQIRSDMIMLPMCGNTHVSSLWMTLDACPADHRDDS